MKVLAEVQKAKLLGNDEYILRDDGEIISIDSDERISKLTELLASLTEAELEKLLEDPSGIELIKESYKMLVIFFNRFAFFILLPNFLFTMHRMYNYRATEQYVPENIHVIFTGMYVLIFFLNFLCNIYYFDENLGSLLGKGKTTIRIEKVLNLASENDIGYLSNEEIVDLLDSLTEFDGYTDNSNAQMS